MQPSFTSTFAVILTSNKLVNNPTFIVNDVRDVPNSTLPLKAKARFEFGFNAQRHISD